MAANKIYLDIIINKTNAPEIFKLLKNQKKIITTARKVISLAAFNHQGMHSQLGKKLRNILDKIKKHEKEYYD